MRDMISRPWALAKEPSFLPGPAITLVVGRTCLGKFGQTTESNHLDHRNRLVPCVRGVARASKIG